MLTYGSSDIRRGLCSLKHQGTSSLRVARDSTNGIRELSIYAGAGWIQKPRL